MTTPSPEICNAIEHLYLRYYWAFDTGKIEAYCDTYADDAELVEYWEGNETISTGREAIRNYVLKILDDPGFVGHQHHGSRPLIDPDPSGRPDHWRVRAYWFVVTRNPGELAVIPWTGYIDDIVVRRDGEFLFKRKHVRPWQGEILDGYGER